MNLYKVATPEGGTVMVEVTPALVRAIIMTLCVEKYGRSYPDAQRLVTEGLDGLVRAGALEFHGLTFYEPEWGGGYGVDGGKSR